MKKKTKQTNKLKMMKPEYWVGLVVVFGMVLGMGVYGWVNQTMARERLRQEAIHGCMETYVYTYDDGEGGVIREPIREKVDECLGIKGYN